MSARPSLKHPNSDSMIDWLQAHGGWGTGSSAFQIDFSMSVLHDDGTAPTVSMIGYPYDEYYSPDCDEPGSVPFPLPSGGSIEGSDDYSCPNDEEDCHLLVVRGNKLFEAYHANVVGNQLQSQCAVRWDLTRVYPPQGRGEQCTSVDAAGFPVTALLVQRRRDLQRDPDARRHRPRDPFHFAQRRNEGRRVRAPGDACRRSEQHRRVCDSVRLAFSVEGGFQHR